MPKFNDKEEYAKWKAEKAKNNVDKLEHQTKEKAQEEFQRPKEQELQELTSQGTLSFSCPKCLSENIQKASLIVSLETKELKATSATVGIGAGSAGGIGVGIGISGTSTNGTITAALATTLRPPAEPKKATIHPCLIATWGISAVLSLPAVFFGRDNCGTSFDNGTNSCYLYSNIPLF